jgi:hypothetical protein
MRLARRRARPRGREETMNSGIDSSATVIDRVTGCRDRNDHFSPNPIFILGNSNLVEAKYQFGATRSYRLLDPLYHSI